MPCFSRTRKLVHFCIRPICTIRFNKFSKNPSAGFNTVLFNYSCIPLWSASHSLVSVKPCVLLSVFTQKYCNHSLIHVLWESNVSEQFCLLLPIGSAYPGNKLRDFRAHPAPRVDPQRCTVVPMHIFLFNYSEPFSFSAFVI